MSVESRALQPLVRQLAHLKVLSRLMGHELHAQASSRTLTLSREEVVEMQTTLDLFIEEAGRRLGSGSGTTSAADAVSAEGEHAAGFEIDVEPVGTVFQSGAASRWYVHVHWPAGLFPDPRPESIAGELVVRFGPEDDLEPMRIPYAGLFR